MMTRKLTAALAVVLLGAVVALAGCTTPATKPEAPATEPAKKDCPPIKVGSMLDAEGSILGSMVIQMLEANGFETVDKTKLGTPDIVRKALLEGEIDATIDYTGSGQYYIEGQEGKPEWNDARAGYELVKQLDKETNDLDWLAPAPANNTELIATTKAFAEKNGIKTMEDLARFANEGGDVKLIGAQAWMDSPVGLKGMEEAYGFKLDDDQLVGLSTGVTAEMLKACANGTDGVTFTEAYGTDGQLDDLGLVIIEDPKSVPPVYAPAPVFRGEIFDACPEIGDIMEPVFAGLDITTLQKLNAEVAFGGKNPKDVAKAYLVENGFLEE